MKSLKVPPLIKEAPFVTIILAGLFSAILITGNIVLGVTL
jgi:hypothetical protein